MSEMLKRLPLAKIYEVAECFQERFMGRADAPNSWRIVHLVVLRKPDAAPAKRIRSFRAIALTAVMSKWFATCVTLRMEEEELEELNYMSVELVESAANIFKC